MKRLDYAVVIDRFDPLDLAALSALRRGLEEAVNVIVLIGASGGPRSARHPWSFEDRAAMVRAAAAEAAPRLMLRPLGDHPYDAAARTAEAQAQVAAAIAEHRPGAAGRAPVIGVIDLQPPGEEAERFASWGPLDVPTAERLPAFELRRLLFADTAAGFEPMRAQVPLPVFDLIAAFRETPAWSEAADEFRAVAAYRKSWAAAPYPPTFVTADAVVVHAGQVLLIQRKDQPGKGQWALPGGFVNPDERVFDAAVRELEEETGLTAPAAVLRESLRGSGVFDDPERSLRGRTITHAFHFDLRAGRQPAVRGTDDAAHARWTPVGAALEMQSALFEDHYWILRHFLA